MDFGLQHRCERFGVDKRMLFLAQFEPRPSATTPPWLRVSTKNFISIINSWSSNKCSIQGVPGECARLRENVSYIKVHRYNPKHLYPKFNCYGDNGERKMWSSCGSTYCTCFACCYPYTAHVRPSVSQPSQTHSDFIISTCHSYSEL